MNRKIIGVVCVAIVGVAAVYIGMRTFGDRGAVAPAPGPGQRPVSIEIATAVKKKAPVRLDALGTVTPMASVAIKSRLDNEITEIHFADGAHVKQGNILVSLDRRSLEAQIQAAEGLVARDQAQLEGAERDVRRYTELVERHATPVTNLENAKTQAAIHTAARTANEAMLRNLRVQLSYTTIRAPISGRISAAALKVGNFVRPADTQSIATIIQTSPIYVTFSVPQGVLPDLRKALAAESATLEALVPGEKTPASGAVTMIENTVEAGTGMVTVRATMPNTDELLWPGTLVTARITLREEDAVVVPAAAVQISQAGNFVFVVKDGVANVRAVKPARTIGNEIVIESGIEPGEVVVTNGFLQLNDGSRVAPRPQRAGV